MAEINLLPDKEIITPEQYSLTKRLQNYGVGILFTSLFMSFIAFFVGQYVLFRYQDTNTKIANVTKTILAAKQKEILSNVAKQKVTGIKEIMASHYDYFSAIEKIKTALPTGVDIKGLDSDEKGNFTLVLEAKDTLALSQLLLNMADLKDAQTEFKNFIVENLSKKSATSIELSVRFII
jgi:hypothetical protein